jgi:hypothetical protein
MVTWYAVGDLGSVIAVVMQLNIETVDPAINLHG